MDQNSVGLEAPKKEVNKMITGFILFGCVMLVSGSFLGALWALNRGPKHRYVGHRQLEGWKGALPFYEFKCPKHGMVESSLHGFYEVLRCPECDEEGKR